MTAAWFLTLAACALAGEVTAAVLMHWVEKRWRLR
jgi:hypothetical protein